jgi:hypothetical protein
MKLSAAARRLVRIRSTSMFLAFLLVVGTSLSVGTSLGVRAARKAPEGEQYMHAPAGTLDDVMAAAAR